MSFILVTKLFFPILITIYGGIIKMKLTETELEVINYLRYLHVRMNKKYHNYSPVQNLSDKEVVSLYNKMDLIIEDEGSIKRSFGTYDEVYIIELNGVKSSLLHEIYQRKCRKDI